MKKINIIAISLLVLLFFNRCEKYDSYIEDYDFTAVYFGTQKPLRTVVAREPMQIKFGVAFGGVRQNTQEQWVKFKIDNTLLQTVDGANNFKLLPKEYYNIELPESDSIFTIKAGEVIGDVVLNLNKNAFTSDSLAVNNTYALPIRIYETSADSILSGDAVTEAKDYTIIVIKYIIPESGIYYVKGSETDQSDQNTIIYSNSDLSKNKTRYLKTLSKSQLEMGGVGTKDPNKKNKLIIHLDENKNIVLTTAEGGVSITDIGSSYNPVNKTFTLKYSYTVNSVTYSVEEELIQRQNPELDLRFEEW